MTKLKRTGQAFKDKDLTYKDKDQALKDKD